MAGEDLTVRFLLKVVVVLLVAAGIFMHFLADLKGYWAAEPKRANSITIAVIVVGIATIVAGFFIVGTPWQARQYRLDEQRVSDLQMLQSEILSFYQQKQVLPGALSQLTDPTLNYSVPLDPSTQQPYEYSRTADLAFQLCATFGAASQTGSPAVSRPTLPPGYNPQDSWEHTAGACASSARSTPTSTRRSRNNKETKTSFIQMVWYFG